MSADSATLKTRLVSRNRKFSVGINPSKNMLIPASQQRQQQHHKDEQRVGGATNNFKTMPIPKSYNLEEEQKFTCTKLNDNQTESNMNLQGKALKSERKLLVAGIPSMTHKLHKNKPDSTFYNELCGIAKRKGHWTFHTTCGQSSSPKTYPPSLTSQA